MGDKGIHIALLAIAGAALMVFPISANAAHYNSKPKISSFVRVQLFHHDHKEENRDKSKKTLLLESLDRDRSRVPTFHQRLAKSRSASVSSAALEAHVESGVSVGMGEYFVDVFIGTPPRKFQLILDTGSDLNWVQCVPSQDCNAQEGPVYNASLSISYWPIQCSAPECCLAPYITAAACKSTDCTKAPSSQCPYIYGYGDSSYTTGKLAFETFTLNRGSATAVPVFGVVFACAELLVNNSGGLLGLGRGPLSFTSQLPRYYGYKFSYCLVERYSNLAVTSTLIFGEDHRLHAAGRRRRLQYTALLSGEDVTYYYLNVSSLTVGGKSYVWDVATGGVIIDSGTTFTQLPQPAYDLIKSAFEAEIGYANASVDSLELCYRVSGVADLKPPEFSIQFGDGAVLKFPKENYFIHVDDESESVVCLAMQKNDDPPSIIGNILQQNFYIVYDVDNSRLGFEPMACAGV